MSIARRIGFIGLLSGLGLLLAGAVLHAPLGAQIPDSTKKMRDTTKKRDSTIAIPVAPRADSLLRDSLAKRDSLHAPIVRLDTIKAPIAHSEMPRELSIGRRLYWSRDSLFASGAVTLADLLERIPGLTTLHAGWISAPALGAYMGDVRRVRVFYDGFEYAGLDPRSKGVLDLTQINLWSVEDATIEQTADEVRVYLRSWRVRSTIPETRTDVSTGDQQTNMYRGFFGKRWNGGSVLQFGAQQYGTTPPSLFGTSSDQTGIIGRVGWARPGLSIDGFITRISRHRGSIIGDVLGTVPTDSIPGLESSRSDMYARVAYADPDVSPMWWQVMAVASKYDYTGIRTVQPTSLSLTGAGVQALPLDTNTYRTQYIATGGTTFGPLRASAEARFITGGAQRLLTPTVRASYTTGPLAVSAFAEGRSFDSTSHVDLTGEFAPLGFLSILGSVGQVHQAHTTPGFVLGGRFGTTGNLTTLAPTDSGYTARYVRGEVGVHVHGLWLIGGILRRDSLPVAPPRLFDTTFVTKAEGPATGITAAVRGHVWGPINADVWAIRWSDTAGVYRPRYQTRSELFVRTNLLERFPTGDFGLTASIIHEYRSGAHFPTAAGTEAVVGYRTISTLLEIRILSATVSWQFRNTLGERYAQVPFFIMPRQTNFYGVRWYFSD